jgi:UDPglucose 6-dehydrogenase
MKYGVIGVGVVGGAMLKSFQEKTSGTNITVVGYDKYKGIGSFEEMLECQIVFLSLPTLYSDEMKMYDKSSIIEVCQDLANHEYPGLVVIKSTVEPETTANLAQETGLSLVHNPEFLTARTAYEDFHDQRHIIIGHTTFTKPDQLLALQDFYSTYYPDAEFTICSSTESESIKIFCNVFYAVKIQFFNEAYLLCQKTGANYDFVVASMLKNGWINPMHTKVPGTDGQLGYGGMCFPKDTNALLSFMQTKDSPHAVLEAAIRERNTLRSD